MFFPAHRPLVYLFAMIFKLVNIWSHEVALHGTGDEVDPKKTKTNLRKDHQTQFLWGFFGPRAPKNRGRKSWTFNLGTSIWVLGKQVRSGCLCMGRAVVFGDVAAFMPGEVAALVPEFQWDPVSWQNWKISKSFQIISWWRLPAWSFHKNPWPKLWNCRRLDRWGSAIHLFESLTSLIPVHSFGLDEWGVKFTHQQLSRFIHLRLCKSCLPAPGDCPNGKPFADQHLIGHIKKQAARPVSLSAYITWSLNLEYAMSAAMASC